MHSELLAMHYTLLQYAIPVQFHPLQVSFCFKCVVLHPESPRHQVPLISIHGSLWTSPLNDDFQMNSLILCITFGSYGLLFERLYELIGIHLIF